MLPWPGLRHVQFSPATNSETLATALVDWPPIKPVTPAPRPDSYPTYVFQRLSDWTYGVNRSSKLSSLTYHECFCYPISCLCFPIIIVTWADASSEASAGGHLFGWVEGSWAWLGVDRRRLVRSSSKAVAAAGSRPGRDENPPLLLALANSFRLLWLGRCWAGT